MVSRANVPRKMTSAMRLTEAEKIELEWESVWERIGASFCKIQREQEAKLDKILRSLQDLRSTMETKDASSGSCKSQLELPKFSDDLDFQKSIDVDRAIADEDLMEQHSSGRYEEMDIDLKIGVEDCARVSKEIEDIEILEVALTPWQKTVELPLPHNCNLEKVNDIDSEPYVLSSSLESKDYLRVENSRKESVEFGAQNQGILILPHARENAQLKELVVSLPTPVYCNFASKWLLECDHKPKVEMKCKVDCVEFYSKFSHHCNSVSLGL